MTDNSSNILTQQIKDPVFLYFNGTGTLGVFTAKYGFMAFLSLIAIICNTAMVYVTIKSKSLHNRCNIFIALNSLFFIPLLIGQSVKYFLLQTGINFIPLGLCYYIELVPMANTVLATLFNTLIGIDRLLSILFPFWYLKRASYKTFVVLIGLSMAYMAWNNYLFYYGVNLHPDNLVICSVSVLVQPEVDMQIRIGSAIQTVFLLLCYVSIWVVIAYKRNAIESKKRRLITSLTVLIAINLFGYVQTSTWRLILSFGILKLNAIDVENYVIYPTLCFYTIADGCNAPVLFLFSMEYRASFKKHLGCLFGIKSAGGGNGTTNWATMQAGGNQKTQQQRMAYIGQVSMRQIAEARILAQRNREERARVY